MDFSEFNWLLIGGPVIGGTLLLFVIAAAKRQWTIASLIVGIAHLPVAFIHAVAPFRGVLDPAYPGYSAGIIRAEAPFAILIFTGSVLLGAIACSLIATLNKKKSYVSFVVGYDLTMLILFAAPVVAVFLEGGFRTSRVEVGEYLQFGGVGAFIFEFALLAAPFLLGLLWGISRIRSNN